MIMYRFFIPVTVVFLFSANLVTAENTHRKDRGTMPGEPRIAVQLYVFGAPAAEPNDKLDGVLATVKKAGYEYIQAWLSYYDSEESAKRLDGLLSKYNLSMPLAYTGGPMHTPEKAQETIDEVLRKARIAAEHGLEVVILNPDPLGREKTDEELTVQNKSLDRLGEELKKIGLRLAIHQHAPEMKSGAREWYSVLRNTDPEKVFFCLDLHWVLRGGQDPYGLLEDAGNRILDLHLRNSRNGVWMEELGDGDIDYHRVGNILKKMNYQGYLTVELAHEKGTVITRALGENLKRSLDYTKRVLLVGQP